MTKSKEYDLIFIKKWIHQANSFDYFVESRTTKEQTDTLANIVGHFFKQTGGYFLQEIDSWENGQTFDENHIEVQSIGGAEWKLKIAPPYVLYYGDKYQIPIIDFKEIISEWFAFDNS